MNKAQTRALEFLAERGGSGIIDKYGRILAQGETEDGRGGFATATWLRLIAREYIGGAGGRIFITENGRKALQEAARRNTP